MEGGVPDGGPAWVGILSGWHFVRLAFSPHTTPLEIALNKGYAEIATVLSKAIGEEVPDNVKLQQLSTAMYKEDKEEGKREFSELLSSLAPEYVSRTDVN